jgi:hypothetical protein
MRVLIAAGVLLAAPAARAAVEVKADPSGRLTLRAEATAAEVLDRIGSQTGMKIVYEGGQPRTRVNVAFEGRTPAEAVLLVLEGLGYDYLVRYDKTGTRPEVLILQGPSSTANGAARPAPSTFIPTRPGTRPAVLQPDEEEPEEDDAFEEEEPVAAPTRERAGRRNTPQGQDPGAQPAAPSAIPAAPSYPVSPFAPTPVIPAAPAPAEPAEEAEPADDGNPNN